MRRLQLAALGLAAVVLAGCSTFFTGGGWIAGSNGGKANFGFEVKCTNGDPEICAPANARGTYIDKSAPLSLKFNGGMIGGPQFCSGQFGSLCQELPPGADPEQCMGGVVNYTSLDKKQSGSGQLVLAACDMGEPGRLSGDFLIIAVIDGPYSGYQNDGTIQGGNLQAH